MKILAIDPGTNGAIVRLDDNKPEEVVYQPLPYSGKLVDVGELQSILILWRPDLIAIEKQQVRQRQAGQALIMQNYGRITATIELCGINYAEHTPQAWQAYHGITGDKTEHIAKAQALGFDVPFKTTKTGKQSKNRWHDVADAYLLAVAAYVLPPF